MTCESLIWRRCARSSLAQNTSCWRTENVPVSVDRVGRSKRALLSQWTSVWKSKMMHFADNSAFLWTRMTQCRYMTNPVTTQPMRSTTPAAQYPQNLWSAFRAKKPDTMHPLHSRNDKSVGLNSHRRNWMIEYLQYGPSLRLPMRRRMTSRKKESSQLLQDPYIWTSDRHWWPQRHTPWSYRPWPPISKHLTS